MKSDSESTNDETTFQQDSLNTNDENPSIRITESKGSVIDTLKSDVKSVSKKHKLKNENK